MASSSRLNDGTTRRGWKVPETTAEWKLWGRTRADWPITDEEGDDFDGAYVNYMAAHPDLPPEWSDTHNFLCNQEAPEDQKMPGPLKESCRKANQEIDDLAERWRQNRVVQMEKEQWILDNELEGTVLPREIRKVQKAINAIKKEYDELEKKINDKASWITQCQDIYPH